MDKTPQATWTSFEETTAGDWQVVMKYEHEFNAGLVDRLLAQFELLDEETPS